MKNLIITAGFLSTALISPAWADNVVIDDLIVDGSQCVGVDCVNGESFGFDTLRLKENNTRVKFQDTSSSASFPKADWQLTANASANGGQEYFGIECIDTNARVLSLDISAQNHAIVATRGGVGFGTNSPTRTIDSTDSDTPTLSLYQDGSAGWAPIRWDVSGNEAGFFVRNSNDNTLPLRVLSDAPQHRMVLAAGGIGVGTASPTSTVHLVDADPSLTLEDNDDGFGWRIATDSISDRLLINSTSTESGIELTPDGGLIADGEITSRVDENDVPDYVFKRGYALRTLASTEAFIQKNGHLPNVPSADEMSKKGLAHAAFQLKLLEKVEELTLHAIAQEKRLKRLEAENLKLRARGQ